MFVFQQFKTAKQAGEASDVLNLMNNRKSAESAINAGKELLEKGKGKAGPTAAKEYFQGAMECFENAKFFDRTKAPVANDWIAMAYVEWGRKFLPNPAHYGGMSEYQRGRVIDKLNSACELFDKAVEKSPKAKAGIYKAMKELEAAAKKFEDGKSGDEKNAELIRNRAEKYKP